MGENNNLTEIEKTAVESISKEEDLLLSTDHSKILSYSQKYDLIIIQNDDYLTSEITIYNYNIVDTQKINWRADILDESKTDQQLLRDLILKDTTNEAANFRIQKDVVNQRVVIQFNFRNYRGPKIQFKFSIQNLEDCEKLKMDNMSRQLTAE